MWLSHLWLTDFRSYETAEVALASGLTVVVGDNGAGKTNLIEGLAFALSASSFRHAGTDALIRNGADSAVVRAQVGVDGRDVLVEMEIPAGRGATRILVNRQRVRRVADLLELGGVTVFAPDDLEIVKGGPGERRRAVDDAIVAVRPRHESRRRELRRVLGQRNALLRTRRGRLTPDVEMTLDVWDQRLAEAGDRWAATRNAFLSELEPHLVDAHATVSGGARRLAVSYEPEWVSEGLAKALARRREEDVRRGVTTVGPHRDDIVMTLDGLPTRTHASQGEQRSVALSLRLAVHRLATSLNDAAPVLLLDDVFSELDDVRGAALLEALPPGQTVLTTASRPPAGVSADALIRLEPGGRFPVDVC